MSYAERWALVALLVNVAIVGFGLWHDRYGRWRGSKP